jgi:hypothetical protein
VGYQPQSSFKVVKHLIFHSLMFATHSPGREFCIVSVWSTPRNAGNHAKLIRRVIDNCTVHNQVQEEEEN